MINEEFNPDWDEKKSGNGDRPFDWGKPLFEFGDTPPDAAKTLLGNRFLCREGGMLFIGPSGIGKSAASVQQDVLWSLGRLAFDIKPCRPLKILHITAEDDDGDLSEMIGGFKANLKLSKEEEKLTRQNCIAVKHKAFTGHEFLQKIVRPLLEKYRPDLLRINPLQAYLGADIQDSEKTSSFLRNGLNPLLEEFNCAAIIVHHTPKTNFRNTETWKASDWMYAGAGAADITNWARSALVAEATDDPAIFMWIAAKRGARIGWADTDGKSTIFRYFSHDKNSIFWHPTDPTDIPLKAGRSKVKRLDPAKILEIMPAPPLDISREELTTQVQEKFDAGINKAKSTITILIDNGALEVIKKPRPNTKPAIFLRLPMRSTHPC
jgi:hypothetical protein